MLQYSVRLQALLQTYVRMTRLDGYDQASRGREFNRLIAEALQCWGIDAKHNIPGSGEIDVGFELEGRHFVLEAKWDAPPTNDGPISKLKFRLRQRLPGTVGIFLSMNGFTKDALKTIKEGEQPAVICLSREHLEAFLSGFIPPAEFFKALVRAASQPGEFVPSLQSLYPTPSLRASEVIYGPPVEVSPLVVEAVLDLKAQVLLSHLSDIQGVASLGKNSLLLTLSSGMWEADLKNRELRPFLALPNCTGSPLVMEDGSILVARAAGIARVEKNELTFIAGGLPVPVRLFRAPHQRTALGFSGGLKIPGFDVNPHVLHLGNSLGEQQREELDIPEGWCSNAAQLPDESYLVFGSRGVWRVPRGGRSELILDHQWSSPMGLVAEPSSDAFIVASNYGVLLSRHRAKNCVALWRVDVERRNVARLATLNLGASAPGLASLEEDAHLLFSYYAASDGNKGILVRVQCPKAA